MMTNVIEKLEEAAAGFGAADAAGTIEVRRHERPYPDISLFQTWDDASTALIARAMEGLPEVASVKRSRSKLSIRLRDEYVDAVGASVEHGETLPVGQGSGRPHLIGFLGPNTSKALHLGHLRNIVIGNALACTFKSAGFNAQSYSLVGYIGRNVCEAMAGRQLYHAANDPEAAGLKPDHYVGRCYATTCGSPAGRRPSQPIRAAASTFRQTI